VIRELGSGFVRLVLPILCMAGSAWFIYEAQVDASAARAERDRVRRSLEDTRSASAANHLLGTAIREVSQPESTAEEAQFIDGLHRHAANSRVSILKLSSTSERYVSDPKKPETKALAGLARISSHVSAIGSYAALYRFVQSLSTSHRFYTLSDVRWTREGSANRLSFSITRFVDTAPSASEKGSQ
jgi:hypothetical protein